MAYSNFESGVSSYVHGIAVIDAYFPVDKHGTADVRCIQCDYYTPQTRKCKITGKVSAYPEHYVGQNCPLQFDDGESENK